MEVKELKIGQTGVKDNVKYRCVKEGDNRICGGCAFDELGSCYDNGVHIYLGECNGEDREDGKGVIFQKIS